jgi:hypothetical protein
MADDLLTLSDDVLVTRLQRAAFSYLTQYADPQTGLVADTSRPGSPSSIAVTGFALSCYPVGVKNGWMTRAEAAERTLRILQFFQQSAQGAAPDTTGYQGLYYHFLDMRSGKRVWQCELSLIDSALLIAGMLIAAVYYDSGGAEKDIRALADALYRRVQWHWAEIAGGTLAQGWRPESGVLHYGWEGYNEATILYILGLGSPTFPLGMQGYASWRLTYQWENLLGQDVLYSGPLFTHLFSHAWIDFRGLRDEFMRSKNSDYFENTIRTIALHREYGARNPKSFTGYGRDFWGVSAGDGPGDRELRESGRDRRFFGYMSRGVPYGPDDGTISPWAMLATLPFTPEAALSGTRHLLRHYPQVCREDRLNSGINPTLIGDDGQGWLSDGWYGLDQGLLVMMIENHRSGMLWDIFRRSPYVRTGLTRAGFTGGWLSA